MAPRTALGLRWPALCALVGVCAATAPMTVFHRNVASVTKREQVLAVEDLISRVVGSTAAQFFSVEILSPSACTGKPRLCFEYAGAPEKKIHLAGTTGVEIAMALNHYLKHETNSSISWKQTGGNHISLPSDGLVPPQAKVHIERAMAFSYNANVCTFSYSYVWYDWADWQREIDWMAMNGINLPLAYTGQEAIYQKLYNHFGVNNESLSDYFGGPAFLAWNRGQGLMAWGGKMDVLPKTPGQTALPWATGLPQSWIDQQWVLQRQILARSRSLGMKPILPGFQGNVPLAMHTLYPEANISRVGTPANILRSHYASAAWIDCEDPLFDALADTFMRILIDDFGTDHFYDADGTFSHAAAPWLSLGAALKDPEFRERAKARSAAARVETSTAHAAGAPSSPPAPVVIDKEAYNHSKAAYAGMSRTDPDAIWVYQTWSWLGGAQGEPSYMKGWITAVPKGRLILLDLMAEESPLWQRSESYYGAPFIWCMLNNFGGNNGMWGDFASLSVGPSQARASGSSIVGVGLTPEGIWHNPAVYDLMTENAYRETGVDVDVWARAYAGRRYGASEPGAQQALSNAWSVFSSTVYSGHDGEMVSKDTTTGIPFGGTWDHPFGTDDPSSGVSLYDNKAFARGWESMLDAVKIEPQLATTETFTHDLVDVTRQALSKHAARVYRNLSVAWAANDTKGIAHEGHQLLTLIDDLDTVLLSATGFLFGSWVQDAERHGTTPAEVTMMRWNAMTQVSFWEYPQPLEPNGTVYRISTLQDYACKQWAGLIRTYYRPRWELFLNQTLSQLAIDPHAVFDVQQFHTTSYQLFNKWRNGHDEFVATPQGDSVALTRAAFEKYRPDIY